MKTFPPQRSGRVLLPVLLGIGALAVLALPLPGDPGGAEAREPLRAGSVCEAHELRAAQEANPALEIEIQRKMLALEGGKDMATRELQLEVAAAEAEFNEKLRLVIQQFGRDEGFSLLLESSIVAWASNSIEVTTAVIDLFDRMYPAPSE